MSDGFSAKSVSKLAYDFREIPREDGEGKCSGRGVVAEPSESRVLAFQKAFFAMANADEPEEGEENGLAQIRSVLADLCGGSPSADEIDALPPRHLVAFGRWLFEELTGPKAL